MIPYRTQLAKYVFASAVIAAVVYALLLVSSHANLATVALLLVLAVTAIAIAWGSGPALLAALWSGMCLNYFFIPPVRTFTIDRPQDWVTFCVFFATALLVGHLSSRAKRQAEAAEARRVEIQRLYEQLQRAFEEASEAESLRRSDKLKTALLDAVTHDLRTPLTSIKASVTTLIGSPHNTATLSSEAATELLQVIDEESDRLNRFVEEMMELAQLEAGHLALQPAPTAAADIIAAAVNRAARQLAGHRVDTHITEPMPLLQVDAVSISGVVFELLENAAQQSPPDAPIAVRAAKIASRQAEIAVEDEGPGVPPELRERVFDKFFRGAHQPDDRLGFGLGLAIARGLVEANGGHIWIESRQGGRGARVAFTVPCESET